MGSVVHLLRTIPNSKIQIGLKRYDDYVTKYFEKIIGSSLNSSSKTQFRLPIRKGGFGFRSTDLHSEAAYKASYSIFMDPNYKQTQKIISEILDNNLYSEFLENLDTEDQIRIRFCTEPQAGAWISAPPSFFWSYFRPFQLPNNLYMVAWIKSITCS